MCVCCSFAGSSPLLSFFRFVGGLMQSIIVCTENKKEGEDEIQKEERKDSSWEKKR